jgi:hypothetical protein
MRNYAIVTILFAVLSCHERINPYDPGNEEFTTPPPIHLAYPIGGWYDQLGYLIGVRVQVDFTDAFSVSMSILNVLTSVTSVLARESVSVYGGQVTYYVDLISDSAMPPGDYLVIFYWADVSIGSCPFSVIDEGGKHLIQNVTEYDTLNTGN